MDFCDLLGFPDEFKVNKEIGKEKLLKSANLIDSERSKVNEYVKSIRILYDIKDSNKETCVIYVTLEYVKDADTIKVITRALANSIPYQCLFIVENHGFIRFCAPMVRTNKSNSYRSVVEEYISTPYFCLDDILLDKNLIYMIMDLQHCVENVGLRKNLMLNFSLAIDSMKRELDYKHKIGEESYKERAEYMERFSKIINNESLDTEDDNMLICKRRIPIDSMDIEDAISIKEDEKTTVYIADVFDKYDDIATIDIIKDCMDYCYSMFAENFDIDDISSRLEEMWLYSYVKACNKLLIEEGKPQLSKYGYRRLKTEFDKGIVFKDEFQYHDELNENLTEFYEYFN